MNDNLKKIKAIMPPLEPHMVGDGFREIAHHDSAGNSGIIGQGDVQWMTAGSGVLHKEYHEAEFSKSGGLLHMEYWSI